MHHEDEVRLIAYQIWEKQCCPEGRELEHWFKAEAVCRRDRARFST